MDLQQRLFRLAAELGDLHLHRRGPARQLVEIDAIIAAKAAEIDAVKGVLNDVAAEARAATAAAAAPPSLPDIPERKDPADRCHAECCDEACTCGFCVMSCGEAHPDAAVHHPGGHRRPQKARKEDHDAAPPAPVDASPDGPASSA